jgi:hypothetical protein
MSLEAQTRAYNEYSRLMDASKKAYDVGNMRKYYKLIDEAEDAFDYYQDIQRPWED